MFNFNLLFGHHPSTPTQLPGNLVVPELSEVVYRLVGDRLQVAASIAMGAFLLGDGEACAVGLALDASKSMQKDYGRTKVIPKAHSSNFIAQGMFRETLVDGVRVKVLNDEAKQIAMQNGWFELTQNVVREPVCAMLENLIRTFSAGGIEKGKCEMIYWACGNAGDQIEPAGEATGASLKQFEVSGPRTSSFGDGTKITPAFDYFSEKHRNSNTVLVFITDGRIDDEREIVNATYVAAREIKAGRRKPLKCTLLGVGKKVDRNQFARLDDLEMPEDVADIDIWNAIFFEEVRDLNDAWSEVFDPTTVIGTNLKVFDQDGKLVTQKTDEVKALITFEMPANSKSFGLEIDGIDRITQSLTGV